MDKIATTYLARASVPKYAHRATLTDIRGNDFNLNLPRYVDTYEEEGQIDLMAVRAERLRLKSEMEGLETRMAGYLRELGYGS